ncbi:MAG: hypothetical protein AB7N24_08375 [Dehalococcoidia bacterium]
MADERDLPDFDFRNASLTEIMVKQAYARLRFSEAHTHGRFDWWELSVAFPGAPRIEFGGLHVELPVHVGSLAVEPAGNEFVPAQRLLTLNQGDSTGFWMRIRFSDIELVANRKVEDTARAVTLPPPKSHLVVQLEVLPVEEGGRHGHIFSGYRPNWWIGHQNNGEKAYNDAEVTLLGREWAFPGETVTVALQPVAPEYWDHVKRGAVIEMCEGAKVCGYGTVVEVSNPN